MSDQLVFYTNPMSRGRVARWMLEEVGLPYRTELLDYATSMKAPEYRAINPMGKVPALVHGDRIITETAAICAYLADAFPEAGLAPPVSDRADYYRWLFFAAGPIEHSWVDRAIGATPTPEQQRMVGYGSFEAVFETLDAMLADREYVAANRFSAADVYLGSQLGFGMEFGMIEKRPAFTTYVARLTARPAWIRARETDEALTPKRETA